MQLQQIKEIVWNLKDIKENLQKQIDDIDKQISLLLETNGIAKESVAENGKYIYYVVDNDIFERAKVGKTTGDKSSLEHRYKTYMGNVEIVRFERVTDCDEAERVLLKKLTDEKLMWSQRTSNYNSGTELIGNTKRSLNIFQEVVDLFT